jgi:toxin-antitoxin system PIN domain toxin
VIAIDTNILVHAHREEMPLHVEALALVRSLAEGDGPWGVPAPCLAEFVRVVTHARVFKPPTELNVAFDFLDRLMESPSARLLLPGPKFLDIFRKRAERAAASGNLAFDAQIAAICIETGATEIVTADRDFARFEGLTPRSIVASPPDD